MSKIVEIPFYADQIQAVREGERVWVVVKRVCEALGIDSEGQRQRLRDPARSPWAVACITQATGPDGKTYEVFALDLKSLPLWLATIDAGRVKPEARFQLVAYQRECADALARHFFGATNEPNQSELLAAVQSIAAAVVSQARAIGEMQAAIVALGQRSNALITRSESRSLAGRITRAGKLKARLQPHRTAKSWAQRIRMHVTAAAGWSGSGCRYENMPAQAYPQADRALSLIERELQEKAPPPERQLSLVKTG